MPVNKSAHLRYRIIDSCLTNRQKTYPTLQFIIAKIEEQLGNTISESMLRKDFQQMKDVYGAPIKYDRNRNGYYYTENSFSIKDTNQSRHPLLILSFYQTYYSILNDLIFCKVEKSVCVLATFFTDRAILRPI